MAEKEILVVQSKVKALAKKAGYRFSGDAVKALSECVSKCVAEAGKRAKANRRSTIKEQDI
jgi:histone H3/H4